MKNLDGSTPGPYPEENEEGGGHQDKTRGVRFVEDSRFKVQGSCHRGECFLFCIGTPKTPVLALSIQALVMLKGCGLRTEDFEPSHVDDFEAVTQHNLFPLSRGNKTKKSAQ